MICLVVADAVEVPIIVGLKNCRVKVFQGRSLSSGDAFRYEVLAFHFRV
jgi:hypothetical protein